jgi:hypothetical protein
MNHMVVRQSSGREVDEGKQLGLSKTGESRRCPNRQRPHVSLRSTMLAVEFPGWCGLLASAEDGRGLEVEVGRGDEDIEEEKRVRGTGFEARAVLAPAHCLEYPKLAASGKLENTFYILF